tara:strand:+ start:136 stop:447 length:312 start_codon:yes stop_codon:yes gene_type:complete
MADFWLFFVKKINSVTKKITHYLSLLIKNIIYSSKKISKTGIDQIEIKKLQWELKQNQEKLGAYIYKCQKLDGTFDFSNDVYFDQMIKKIKENQNFINKKIKN